MDFSKVKSITIPQGNVRELIINGIKAWSGQVDLVLIKNSNITSISYKVNDSSSYITVTDSTTIKVQPNTTFYVYATTETGYETTYNSSNPYSGTIGTSGYTFNPTATLINYTITVNGNGGTASVDIATYTYSASNQTRTLTYSRSGYNLSSWTVSGGSASASGHTLTINAGSTGNITLKANWSQVSSKITLTNPKASLVFYSLSGNLYTNSARTTLVRTNTKYTQTVFYYAGTKPTGSYIYNYGEGQWDNTFKTTCATCTERFVKDRCSDGTLKTCVGTTRIGCWTVTMREDDEYDLYPVYINFSNCYGFLGSPNATYHRINALSF